VPKRIGHLAALLKRTITFARLLATEQICPGREFAIFPA
jgi:hypothetical protein